MKLCGNWIEIFQNFVKNKQQHFNHFNFQITEIYTPFPYLRENILYEEEEEEEKTYETYADSIKRRLEELQEIRKNEIKNFESFLESQKQAELQRMRNSPLHI